MIRTGSLYTRKPINQSIPVDMKMIKDFNTQYESYKQKRMRNGDDELFREESNEGSERSPMNDSRLDFDDEGPLTTKEDSEDELYMSRKRDRIKFHYLRQVDPTVKAPLHINKNHSNNNAFNSYVPKKINNVVENYKMRAKEALPQIKGPRKSGIRSSEGSLSKPNLPTIIKKKAQGMAIFVFKEKNSLDDDSSENNFDTQPLASKRSLASKSLAPLIQITPRTKVAANQIKMFDTSISPLKTKSSMLSHRSVVKSPNYPVNQLSAR